MTPRVRVGHSARRESDGAPSPNCLLRRLRNARLAGSPARPLRARWSPDAPAPRVPALRGPRLVTRRRVRRAGEPSGSAQARGGGMKGRGGPGKGILPSTPTTPPLGATTPRREGAFSPPPGHGDLCACIGCRKGRAEARARLAKLPGGANDG